MTLPGEILGEFVDTLRVKRAAGATAYELVHFLRDSGIRDIPGTFEAAFLGWFSWVALLTKDESGAAFGPEKINRSAERYFAPIAAKGDAWRSAPPYPDLMCRRDREAFRAVSKRLDCHIFVQASNPASKQYRFRAGYRPAPSHLFGVVADVGPSAGLYFAAPNEPRLDAFLKALGGEWTYATYIAELERASYSVAGEAEGWVVRDGTGAAFYPGYRIHGIYDCESGASLWTRSGGEAIRRELNLRMGAALVPRGPDVARQSRATLTSVSSNEPCIPMLRFGGRPGGNVREFTDVMSLRREYRSKGFLWPYEDDPLASEGTT